MKRTTLLYIISCLVSVTMMMSCRQTEKGGAVTRSSQLGVECQALYNRAHTLQHSTKYDEALALYRKCLTYDSPEDSVREHIRAVTVEVMLQLLNTHLASGRNVECGRYFLSLVHRPTPLIRQYCMRDLYSIAAYACFMADVNKEAFSLIDKALSMPLYRSDAQRLFRDYTYATAIYNSDSKYQTKAVACCKKALQAGYSDKKIVGLEWLTELLGTIYVRQGDIDKAIDVYHRTIRSFQNKGNLKGEIDVTNKLVDLYTTTQQYRQANIFADIAVAKCQQLPDHDPAFCGASYLKKANVMVGMNKIPSAMYYLKRARQYYDVLPYGNGNFIVDQVLGELYLKENTPVMRRRGIACLQRALPVVPDVYCKAEIYLQMAKSLISDGRTTEGEAMLDSMHTTLKSFATPMYVSGAYQYALNHYLAKHDAAKTRLYAAEYIKEANKLFNDEVARKTSHYAVKYNTEKKEHQLRIAREQLKNKALKTQIAVLVGVMLLIIVIGLICFIEYKKRIFKLRNQLMQQRLAELTSDLDELRTDVSNSRLRESAVSDMNMENGETRFRNSFVQRYPMFLSELKKQAPDITHREELLCMLLTLDYTPDQIADIFCVTRKSLNMMRYRIRAKLHSDHDDSLEENLKKILR